MAHDKTQSAKRMDVRYVANLARLDLTDAEVEQFQAQLDHIVEHFNQLRALDVEGVEPMAHATVIENVFREVREATDTDDDYRRVPYYPTKPEERLTEITPEILGGLAPFRTAHINRFGDYTLDFRRKIGPLDFEATIIPIES